MTLLCFTVWSRQSQSRISFCPRHCDLHLLLHFSRLCCHQFVPHRFALPVAMQRRFYAGVIGRVHQSAAWPDGTSARTSLPAVHHGTTGNASKGKNWSFQRIIFRRFTPCAVSHLSVNCRLFCLKVLSQLSLRVISYLQRRKLTSFGGSTHYCLLGYAAPKYL